jgi:hypothetical protein
MRLRILIFTLTLAALACCKDQVKDEADINRRMTAAEASFDRVYADFTRLREEYNKHFINHFESYDTQCGEEGEEGEVRSGGAFGEEGEGGEERLSHFKYQSANFRFGTVSLQQRGAEESGDDFDHQEQAEQE